MTGLIGGRWTAGNRLEPSRPNGRGRRSCIRFLPGRDPAAGRPAPARGHIPRWPWRHEPQDKCCMVHVRARGRADRSLGERSPLRAIPPVWRRKGLRSSQGRVRGARGRERAGPTRSHPEPGRDPAQRRRVLWGRPHGRRGRRGHPPPSHAGAGARRRSGADSTMASRPRTRRGVEQRQLVGLITQRSGVRIPPPLPQRKSDRAILLGRFLLF
jgi:hypothetical protein